uniref:Peptidase metallopeptidase domain-containing protein n=1 Tax=Knipowitschia caucasica TaxID=637954 RepID=A0AAV2LGB0_KNICA
MLTSIQQRPFCIVLLVTVWTGISSDAERLFHQRDHSDLKSESQHRAQPITDSHTAELFLSKYGFLKPVNWEDFLFQEPEEPDFSFLDLHEFSLEEGSAASRSREDPKPTLHDPQFTGALRDFQVLSGLPVTGVLDEATKEAMNQPRCGVPDIEAEFTEEALENLEMGDLDKTRNHRRRNVKGLRGRVRRDADGFAAFSKSVLRWRLMGEGYSSQLSVEEQRYVFRLAFRMWSEVCPLDFIEDTTSPLEEVDIRLGFGTGRHLGCKQRFDGSGREFAHAWFLGDIHFDDDEHFTGPNAGKGISLLKVAVHEIGHVLGLPHIHRAGSIMQPSYLPQESRFEMDWTDRRAIQNLYAGGCRGRFSTVFDWIRTERTPSGEVVVRFNTYFMREGWYWLYENRNNRTRYGDPVSVQSGWRGLPFSGVDAFVHVWSRRKDHVYFFKGSQFWRYDSDQDQVFRRDPDGQTYPRPITEGFPGVPAPIDTAVFDRRDGNIYFFKGALVFAFSVDSQSVARGFPRPLRSVFPSLDPQDHPHSDLDAAYFSYSHNALFLFKDTAFWRVASSRDQRRQPQQQRNTLMPRRRIHEQWYDICNVHPTALQLRP